MGQDKKALGIRTHRFYFEDDCKFPTCLPENQLDTLGMTPKCHPVMRIVPAVEMGKRLALVWDEIGSLPTRASLLRA